MAYALKHKTSWESALAIDKLGSCLERQISGQLQADLDSRFGPAVPPSWWTRSQAKFEWHCDSMHHVAMSLSQIWPATPLSCDGRGMSQICVATPCTKLQCHSVKLGPPIAPSWWRGTQAKSASFSLWEGRKYTEVLPSMEDCLERPLGLYIFQIIF